jgi:hypothetical protein
MSEINPEVLEVILTTARETARAIWDHPAGEVGWKEWLGSDLSPAKAPQDARVRELEAERDRLEEEVGRKDAALEAVASMLWMEEFEVAEDTPWNRLRRDASRYLRQAAEGNYEGILTDKARAGRGEPTPENPLAAAVEDGMSVVDSLMGDTDLDCDDSPAMQFMQKAKKALRDHKERQ